MRIRSVKVLAVMENDDGTSREEVLYEKTAASDEVLAVEWQRDVIPCYAFGKVEATDFKAAGNEVMTITYKHPVRDL